MTPVGGTQTLAARRAIEALRAGVPNGDAVRALPSLQTEVDDRFAELLETVTGAGDRPPGGLLLGGGFGSGKSHLLAELAHRALDSGFAVSRVVVSKETVLHDPASMFRAAVENLVVPGRPGSPLTKSAGVCLRKGSHVDADAAREWQGRVGRVRYAGSGSNLTHG